MSGLLSLLNPEGRAAFAALYRLSWPVVMSRLGFMMMGLADTLVVGHYSAAELGYHSLAWAPTSIFLVTSIGLLVGVQVKTAQFIGADEPDRIGGTFQRALAYALILGFGSMSLLTLGGPWLLHATVQPGLAAGASTPLLVFALSMPFYMVAVAVSEFLEGLGRTRPGMVFTWGGNVLNVALLLVLVPGIVKVPGIDSDGAMGAAISTLVARMALTVGLLIYLFTLKHVKIYDLLGRHARDPQGAREQRQVGYAAGASYFIEVAAFAGLTVFAGRISETAVAVWAIILNFASLVFMVPMGLAIGCSVLVGRAYGAKDAAGVARMGRVSFLSATGFMMVVVLTVLIGSQAIAAGYTSDATLIAGVQTALLLSCLFFIPDGVQVVAAQALRARHDVLVAPVLHYISYGMFMLPLGYLFALHWAQGVPGLIYACAVASWLSATLLVARFFWLDKKAATLSTPAIEAPNK
ncbi:MATE family efflux transporter [Asticcacaulis sp. AC402]|uniref:MATE family efflux transporter n=1 Tax=Asticcacaulis sp. AC402 TaxID=1282361 RepID=UPI0003C404C9|nr:MATE family efflux transporter [Asticcacaulis sp. AC402]ESQ76843.1 multidrug transporter MATE [Asticcacaulis sp. AC402]